MSELSPQKHLVEVILSTLPREKIIKRNIEHSQDAFRERGVPEEIINQFIEQSLLITEDGFTEFKEDVERIITNTIASDVIINILEMFDGPTGRNYLSLRRVVEERSLIFSNYTHGKIGDMIRHIYESLR